MGWGQPGVLKFNISWGGEAEVIRQGFGRVRGRGRIAIGKVWGSHLHMPGGGKALRPE